MFILAADLLKMLLSAMKNPQKEPNCISLPCRSLTMYSLDYVQKCFILDANLSLSITNADYKAF